ncbi:unnamed protein product, partial [Agarophyton chilense]
PTTSLPHDPNAAHALRQRLHPLPLQLLHHPQCAPPPDASPTTVTAFSSSPRAPRAPSLDAVPLPHLADTLASILTHVCATAPRCTLPNCSDPLAFFFCPTKQTSFTMSYYCRRLLQFNHCSKSCVPLALIYLLRIEANQQLHINDFNVHRLVCTAFVLAAKWQDDVSYSNLHYATVAGVASVHEMNILERHMLNLLDHRLFVTADRYQHMESYILQLALRTH